jgi:poly(A) polymerase
MVGLPAGPGFIAVIAALDGAKGSTRLVGGCVRDALAEQVAKDVDLATIFTPDEVVQRLAAADVKSAPTGIEHGTITAITDDGPIEITTLRKDISTDGRRATIAFTDNWQDDAARRDFTINALYAHPVSGEIFDYFGGQEDLKRGIVRFIGDPLHRIAEDHLRILRFFRFHARIARGAPDAASLSACAARANDLMALSRERIADELLKILALDDPAPVIGLMITQRIFTPILPEIKSATLLAQLIERENESEVPPDPIRRLAALMPADPILADAVAVRLRLSKVQRKRLKSAAARTETDTINPRALTYWLGRDGAIDRLLLLNEGKLDAITNWHPPILPLTGGAIVARGVKMGPEVARLLKAVEQQWVAEGFPDVARTEAILSAML